MTSCSAPPGGSTTPQLRAKPEAPERAQGEGGPTITGQEVSPEQVEPDWAGTYSSGSWRSFATIKISLQHGLNYSHATDVLGSDVKLLATILAVNGNRIEVEFSDPRRSYPDQSEVYVFVPWGDRRFLVPEARMMEFCFWANTRSGWASSTSPFPVKKSLDWSHREDDDVPPPIVPAEYFAYVLQRPVTASVLTATSVFSDESYAGSRLVRTSITAGAGSAQGLLAGMSLFLVDIDGYGRGLVESVDDSTCSVVFLHRQPDGDHPLKLVAGAKLSSIAPRD